MLGCRRFSKGAAEGVHTDLARSEDVAVCEVAVPRTRLSLTTISSAILSRSTLGSSVDAGSPMVQEDSHCVRLCTEGDLETALKAGEPLILYVDPKSGEPSRTGSGDPQQKQVAPSVK